MESIFLPLSGVTHWIATMAGLVFASAFYSSSETALFFLSPEELRRFRVGRAQERAVARLLADPDRLLTAILFYNLIINLLYFAVSVVVAHELTVDGHPAVAALFSLASVFVLIVFGEVVPKSLAVVFRHRLSRMVVWPLAATVRLLDWVVPKLAFTARVLRRAFWPHVVREPHLDADDLERAVEATAEQSAQVLEAERKILHNILDLSEITVEEVMRPRGTYLALPAPVHLSHLQSEAAPGDYVAVVEAGTDNIESAIHLASFSRFPTEHLEQAAENVPHMPWCASLAYALGLLRNHFTGLGAVVNEYGETMGIVLADDIVDTVLTPQPSRARRVLQHEPVLEVDKGRYHVHGLTTLRYLCLRLDLEYEPTPDNLVTVAGLLYEELEHLPEVGDEIAWRGYVMKVIEAGPNARLRVMMARQEAPEEGASDREATDNG